MGPGGKAARPASGALQLGKKGLAMRNGSPTSSRVKGASKPAQQPPKFSPICKKHVHSAVRDTPPSFGLKELSSTD